MLKKICVSVGGGCEGEECSIDRVCTFSNGTQGVEEGLCTECSCSEGYSGPACASKGMHLVGARAVHCANKYISKR